VGTVFYDYKYSFTMFFWVRVSRNPAHQKMILMFGDEGDFNYFKGRQGYPCYFLAVPPGSGVDFWTLANAGTTVEKKQDLAKEGAITAAKTAGWTVVEETYETQAFFNGA
jgi:hypothetical protein